MACSRFAIAAVVCAAMLSSALTFPIAVGGEADAALAKEAEAIKNEIELLKKDLEKSKTAKQTASKVDKALDKKKPDTTVRTHDGKLQIGGLLQSWYVSYQRDSRGLFDNPKNGIFDTNDANDNSTFEIRRAQLSFTLKPSSFVTAYVMIDPAAEANTFPLVTDNQASPTQVLKTSNYVAPEIAIDPSGFLLGNFQRVQNLQFGQGVANRLLMDAYINFHDDNSSPGDFDWHHDFQVGQFIPAFGEEGLRSNAQLDFVERSFVGLLSNDRDLGAQIHGSWINDRVQYWGGVFDGGTDFHQSNGQGDNRGGANRSDNNDAKDIDFRMLVRPVSNPCWGDMELGYSNGFGYHGESGGSDPILAPANNLGRRRSFAMRQDAWAYYAPGGPLRGFWMRGEWGWFKDRNAPGTVVDVTGNGGTSYINVLGTGPGLAQSNGRAFSVQGWYAAAGYRLDKSGLFDKCGLFENNKKMAKYIKPVELAFRYQTFQNVVTADLVDPSKSDVFSTQVYTGGINYYIHDHNAKIQVNYNAVINPEQDTNPAREFHNVRNNSLVVNFQVAF